MTEQIVQNNHKIIADLNSFSSDLCKLTELKEINKKMSEIRHYISCYRYLNEEFEKKCNSYKNLILSSQGKSYISRLNDAVISELSDTIYTEPCQKYNEPLNFYFPAFFVLRDWKPYPGCNIYDFYNLCDSFYWRKVIEKTEAMTQIKILMENFCFYFVDLCEVNVKFCSSNIDLDLNDFDFSEFNLCYLYSIIDGVLNYFKELIYKNPNIDYSIQSSSSKIIGKVPKTGKVLPKNIKSIDLEILYLLRIGKSQKEIADITVHSTKTIENYIRNIRNILNAKTSIEAIANFIEDYGSLDFYVSEDFLTQIK